MENIPYVQHIHQRAAQTPSPRQLSRQLQILFRGEAPEKNNRGDEHLHTSHKRGRADREVQNRHILRALEPLVLGEELEDGTLGESDADDALEGEEFVNDLVLFQLGGHAAGEPDDAEDADGGGDGLDDAEGGAGAGEFVFDGTGDAAEDPDENVQDEFDREDLEDHDPDHLCAELATRWESKLVVI